MIKYHRLLIVCIMFATSCNKNMKQPINNSIPSPKADKIPISFKKHDDLRIDNYYWLNEKENPEVIDYLERENDYYNKMTAHTKDFQEKLFEEIKGKIKEDDQSVPYFINGYWYVTKYKKDMDYPVYIRRKDSISAKDEVLFNCNELAKDHEYFNLSNIQISSNNKFAAYSFDTVSRRLYTIKIKNLETGKIFNEEINNSSGSFVWANDNSTLFYTNRDSKTLRNDKIFKHKLGTKSVDDQLVYHEKDKTFYTNVSRTKSNKFVVISSFSTITSEFQFVDADNPDDDFKLFSKRIKGVEYSVNHFENYFYIITNRDNAKNYKLMKASLFNTEFDKWENVIDHREDVLIEGIDIFKDYLVVSERFNGLNRINVKRWDNTENYFINFNNDTYTSYTSTNIDFNTNILRYVYSSMTEPYSVIEFDMKSKEKSVIKQHLVID